MEYFIKLHRNVDTFWWLVNKTRNTAWYIVGETTEWIEIAFEDKSVWQAASEELPAWRPEASKEAK